jgi:hypothetical protein
VRLRPRDARARHDAEGRPMFFYEEHSGEACVRHGL